MLQTFVQVENPRGHLSGHTPRTRTLVHEYERMVSNVGGASILMAHLHDHALDVAGLRLPLAHCPSFTGSYRGRNHAQDPDHTAYKSLCANISFACEFPWRQWHLPENPVGWREGGS